MKVTAILKGLVDSNGHQPIQIRVYKDGKRTFYPTSIKIDPESFKEGKVLPKHPKAKEYNERVKNLIIQYQAEALEGLNKKYKKVDFLKYAEDVKEKLERKPGSKRQYGSQITKLKEFSPTLYLHQIDHDFLDRYKAFLRGKDNDVNTVWSSFKFLRSFVRRAWKVDKLVKDNPFDGYEFPPYRETDPLYLNDEELKRIEKIIKSPGISENLKEAGTWFLIACYTGLRISDLKAFDAKKNIVGDRLVVRAQKNREIVGLPIIPKVKAYLERVEYKRMSLHENIYNELLKVIAACCDIDKKISSHTARHTCAMRLTNAGVSQEVIMKILGHNDMRSTRVYSKITNQRIDAEYIKKMK